jgi:hypothetical protein
LDYLESIKKERRGVKEEERGVKVKVEKIWEKFEEAAQAGNKAIC